MNVACDNVAVVCKMDKKDVQHINHSSREKI